MHSTAIFAKIIAVRDNSIIVDAATNLVGDTRFAEYQVSPIVNLSNPSFKPIKKTVFGPLCDPADLWGYYLFSGNCKVGDLVAILNQGAYTFSCSSRFIKPIARYIALEEDGNLREVKKQEGFEDRYRDCI